MGGPSRDAPTDVVVDREARHGVVIVYPPAGPPLQCPSTGTLIVGRAGECDIVVDDPSVSRKHLELAFGSVTQLTDLGGRNGLRVGGKKLPAGAKIVLPTDVVVEFGNAILVLRPAPEIDEEPAPLSVMLEDGADGMRRAERLMEVVAPTPVSVILRGETGVGKDVHAERLHRLSQRREGPFVALNCAAIAENLIESELFGYERGAFTGATQAKVGLLEAADGGTVFLDEIGELPLTLQAKLLRALERREIVPVGGTKARQFDARFVSATHRDLEAFVEEGKFRADLYFRLNGMTIDIPPLRARLNEIEPLTRLFMDESAKRLDKAAPRLSPEGLEALRAYAWPGNVRELKNVIERAVLVSSRGVLEAKHFDLRGPTARGPSRPFDATLPSAAPAALPAPTGAPPVPVTVAEPVKHATLDDEMVAIERARIEEALRATGGNRTRAAEKLGITRKSLLYRMSQWSDEKKPDGDE